MSVLKKSTLSLLCAGLLMSSCSSKCGIGSLFGWIATGGGATLTALSAWFYKSSNQTRLKHQQSLDDDTNCRFYSGHCKLYTCPGNDTCWNPFCYCKKDEVPLPLAEKKICGSCQPYRKNLNKEIEANKSSMKRGKYGMYAGGALAVCGLYLLMKSKKRVEV